MRNRLRWWLWTSCTLMIIGVSGWLGFFGILLKHDITRLGFAVLAVYLISTAWLGLKVHRGDRDYDFIWYVGGQMAYIGVLGTFIGLAAAFQALAGLDPESAEFKSALMAGALSKLYASIVGITGSIFLKTQVKILEVGDVEAA